MSSKLLTTSLASLSAAVGLVDDEATETCANVARVVSRATAEV
jgi:hypothetical protein